MGNQESLPNDRFIVRKKILKEKNKKNENTNNLDTNHNFNIDESISSGKNRRLQKSYSDKQNNSSFQYNEEQYMKKNTNYQPIINEPNKNHNIHNKLVEKQYTNNAIMERNVLSDLYNNQKQQTRVFDYPSNSNNELDIPKKSFDNIEFTPFNFNDEVSKYKKSLNDEREDFDKIEKVRRSKFEKEESEKKNYLESQIKNCKIKYNP